jgi:Zn-dependent protease
MNFYACYKMRAMFKPMIARLILLVTVVTFLSSWKPADFLQELQQKYDAFRTKYPIVKLYCILNQPVYSPGDTVFFQSWYMNEDFSHVKGEHIVALDLFYARGDGGFVDLFQVRKDAHLRSPVVNHVVKERAEHVFAGNQGDVLFIASLSLGILVLSVLAQEIARWSLLRSFGGHCQRLVLGPYGGMSRLEDVDQPRQEMLVHLAAPASSAALAALAAIVLIGLGKWDSQVLHPLQPVAVAEGGNWPAAIKLCLWINALLTLMNLIPAFPFQGGQALRAAILWRAPHLGRREASRWVIRLARLIACLMVVAAVFLLREDPGLQTWSALLLLSVLVFLGAEHEQSATVESSPALPEVTTFESEAEPSIQSHRLRSFVSTDPSPEISDDEESSLSLGHSETLVHAAEPGEDELQVDEILTRVHQHGLSSLTDEDRRILQRASQRYRERLSAKS